MNITGYKRKLQSMKWLISSAEVRIHDLEEEECRKCKIFYQGGNSQRYCVEKCVSGTYEQIEGLTKKIDRLINSKSNCSDKIRELKKKRSKLVEKRRK